MAFSKVRTSTASVKRLSPLQIRNPIELVSQCLERSIFQNVPESAVFLVTWLHFMLKRVLHRSSANLFLNAVLFVEVYHITEVNREK